MMPERTSSRDGEAMTSHSGYSFVLTTKGKNAYSMLVLRFSSVRLAVTAGCVDSSPSYVSVRAKAQRTSRAATFLSEAVWLPEKLTWARTACALQPSSTISASCTTKPPKLSAAGAEMDTFAQSERLLILLPR